MFLINSKLINSTFRCDAKVLRIYPRMTNKKIQLHTRPIQICLPFDDTNEFAIGILTPPIRFYIQTTAAYSKFAYEYDGCLEKDY